MWILLENGGSREGGRVRNKEPAFFPYTVIPSPVGSPHSPVLCSKKANLITSGCQCLKSDCARSISFSFRMHACMGASIFILMTFEVHGLTFSLYFSVSVFLSTLDKQESRSEMPVGSCTVWNTESSPMARCLPTRPSELVMIHSTPSSVRLALGSTSPGLSSLIWNPPS